MNNVILVGVDFSNCSLNALSHAVTVAEKSKSDIVMVWVNKLANDKDIVSKDRNLIEYGAKQHFNELIEKYAHRLGENTITYQIREGRVYDAMQEACRELDPFLMFIGTHGISGFSERWIGSNAFRMSLVLDVPTVFIREGIDVNTSISKIVMPIDSTLETRQKLPLTALIAQYFNAQIFVVALYTSEILSVKERVNGYVKQVVKYLTANRINFVLDELHTNDLDEDIISYAKNINANLISIMDELERTAVNIFSGSYSQKIVNNSQIPVLISHTKNIYASIARN